MVGRVMAHYGKSEQGISGNPGDGSLASPGQYRQMAKSAATRYPAAMKSFNVTMPEELLTYVRTRTKEGGFGTPTEFMRHLIRKDQEERLERELEERLVAGLKSGRSRVPAKKFFERMHRLVDQVSEGKRRKAKGRGGKATRSAARG